MKKQKIEFTMCNHPELRPMNWDEPKPEPVRTVGNCPIHDYVCPLCGFGVGCHPGCGCSERYTIVRGSD